MSKNISKFIILSSLPILLNQSIAMSEEKPSAIDQAQLQKLIAETKDPVELQKLLKEFMNKNNAATQTTATTQATTETRSIAQESTTPPANTATTAPATQAPPAAAPQPAPTTPPATETQATTPAAPAKTEATAPKMTSAATPAVMPEKSPEKPKTEFTYKGHYQFRSESARNSNGFTDTKVDDNTASRLRVYFTFAPNSNLKFNLTPQAVKGFGGKEYSPSSLTANKNNETSGSTYHTNLAFFEANIDYSIANFVSVKLGKQEISYGDHLIVGALPWAMPGRSFDAAKFRFKYDFGWTDVFRSRISDYNTSTLTTDDTNFDGVYSSFNFGDYVKPLDVYLFQNKDSFNKTLINSFGVRLLGGGENFFYRTENVFQNHADANLIDIESGLKFGGYSFSLEYSSSGSGYNQQYPTAHMFLGYADVLKRNNVDQVALHLNGKFTSWFSGALDFHSFSRHKNDKNVTNLSSTTALGSGDSKNIGSEVDLVLTFSTTDNVKLQLGHSIFQPGEYMKDNGNDKATNFSYIQVNADF